MAGVQLLHSLIYLLYQHLESEGGWGSTLALPDILDGTHVNPKEKLGFNSYTP